MKIAIYIHQRNVALQGVIEKYPDSVAGKAEVEAAASQFASNNQRTAELISLLSKPRPVVLGPKIDKLQKLTVETARNAGIGLLLASRKNDVPRTEMYKLYRRKAYRKNYWGLYHTANLLADELAKEGENLADAGLTAAELASYRALIAEFAEMLPASEAELQERNAARQELGELLTANSEIIRNQLEPIANLLKDTMPDFYRDFRIARRYPFKKKPKGKVTIELSGTVTDAATQEPIADATVGIAALDLQVVTDEDGFYLFEEVPSGTHTLTCQAEGYKQPANIQLTTAGRKTPKVDFFLEADQQEAA